jgi:aryl-alcohol dehydrogenase-like predicted oxidoreductase
MRYTNIKNTTLSPSVICLGIADFGVKHSEADGHALLDCFVEHGGNFVDTARIYSDWVPGEKSRSERILGDWLKRDGNRDKVIVATKGAHPEFGTGVPRMGRAEVETDLNGSLKSLCTDVVDLYYLHRDNPSLPVESIIDMLDDFVTAGKVRYYACSNWKPPRIEAALAYARRKGTRGFVANQMLWNIGCYTMRPIADPTIAVFDAATMGLHRRSGIAAVPFSSQANGFFTKLDQKGGIPDEDLKKRDYCTDANLAAYAVMKEVAARRELSVTQIVLLYLLCQPVMTLPVVGCHTTGQIESSLSAADLTLADDELARLEAAAGAKLG